MTDTADIPRMQIPKAAEIIASRMRLSIASGEHRPGDLLASQAELAEAHGVSAPTMREALRILETEGLVTVKRGVRGGAYVNEPSLAAVSRQLGLYLQMRGTTMADVYEARLIFEPPAARLLASRWSDDAERELRACLAHERARADDRLGVGEAGAQFHVRLLELCGNQTVAALAAVITEIVQRHTAAAVVAAEARLGRTEIERAFRRQEKLIELMAAGDGDAAEAHWRRFLHETLSYIEQGGDADTVLDLVS